MRKMQYILLIFLLPLSIANRYTPDWGNLSTRTLPEWYDKAKIGVLVVWGVRSVPGIADSYIDSTNKEYKQFLAKNYRPGFTYQEFAPKLTAEFFDPDRFATLFQNAGAKYILTTNKHQDGFALFPSKRSYSWNSVDVGPHRDIVGELSKSVRSKGMKFGVHYTFEERTNPLFAEDKKVNFKTRKFVDLKVRPEIKQLINDYKPSIFLGWTSEGPDSYWNSSELVAWLYNDSPVKDEIVTYDRWYAKDSGTHGDVTSAVSNFDLKEVGARKWECEFTLDSISAWYRKDAQISEIRTIDDLLLRLVSAVSCGGNLVIDVAVTQEGTIIPIFQERLLALGDWLKINGEAIYDSSPWFYQNDKTNKDVWYTCRRAKYNATNPTAKPLQSDTVTAFYAILLKWPKGGKLTLQEEVTSRMFCDQKYEAKLLGNKDDVIEVNFKEGKSVIMLPDKTTVASKNAWTLKFTPGPRTRRQETAVARWCRRRRSGGRHRGPRTPVKKATMDTEETIILS